MRTYPKSAEILNKNKEYIPGGVVSVNRATSPEIAFVKGQGAYLWDADDNRYIDYHGAFAAHILGHDDPYVTDAVERVLRSGASLFGSGATVLKVSWRSFCAARCPAWTRSSFSTAAARRPIRPSV